MAEIIKYIKEIFVKYQGDIILGVFVTLIGAFIIMIVKKAWKCISSTPKNINYILNNIDYNSQNWKIELNETLGIDNTMKSNFPDYKGYLLIQYGSSVLPDNSLPSDYDFIVLMLGYPEGDIRYMHNKGTTNTISEEENKNHVDIVYRDYLSFLYAASAGMPYENSIITEGRLISGHEGYFQWMKNMTKNNLFDRDFIVRRYKDKVAIEKQEFQKCLNEHEKYGHDKYYVIRSGYYYITSLMQLKRITKFEKVVFQGELVELSKVRNLYGDFEDDVVRGKYIQLVENLKRNPSYQTIGIEDIKYILANLDDGAKKDDDRENKKSSK